MRRGKFSAVRFFLIVSLMDMSRGNGKTIGTGVYLIKMVCGNKQFCQKAVLVK